MNTNPYTILYEDEYLMVIDKPAGLVVNDSLTHKGKTLQTMLKEDETSLGLEDELDRSGIVHRLDKDTSGVMLIAKNAEVMLHLQEQFKGRTINKTYLVLVYGKVAEDSFKVDAPIARDWKNRMKFCVSADGKEAQTEFVKLKEIERAGETYTLLQAHPITGRTHQIRVHLTAFGNAVVGDPVYGGKRGRDKKGEFSRLMLHANKITFKHPVTKEYMTFEAAIPQEFKM